MRDLLRVRGVTRCGESSPIRTGALKITWLHGCAEGFIYCRGGSSEDEVALCGSQKKGVGGEESVAQL